MSLLHPSYLWGLFTLAIPIAIHLLSRKEGKVIRVGSLRHIYESNTSQFKSIRLNELLLLLLRLLMISALVLFLSGTQCTNTNLVEPPRWLVIEAGVETEPMATKLIDSLVADGYELRQFKEGFPLLTANTEQVVVNYWQLADELAGPENRKVIALTYNHADGFIGKRRPLPPNVQWIVIDEETRDTRYAVNALQLRGDSARLHVAETTPAATMRTVSFVRNKSGNKWLFLPGLDSVPVETPTPIKIGLLDYTGYETEMAIMRSALNVISKESGVPITIENSGAYNDVDWMISLAYTIPPRQANQIYYNPRPNTALFELTGSTSYRMTKHLTNEVALKENLVIGLGAILLPTSNRADHRDRRVLDDRMAWSEAGIAGAKDAAAKTDLSKYLLIAFFALWILERLAAWSRNQ